MSYFLHIQKKLSKYVKINTMIIFLLIILFAISLRFLERYEFYNFHEVINRLKIIIMMTTFFFLYVCFKYLSYEDRKIPIALCFGFIYFCFEFIFRQTFILLNIGEVNNNLMLSKVNYPFLIGLTLRPIIILFALNNNEIKLFQIKKKNVVLLLIALLSGACTALIDLYIILPHCSDLSEQKIVITYINAILVNLFVVIISIVHSINNKDEFLNVLIYSTLLPIFSKYYAFYSNRENSVYIVASEIIMIVLLVTALIYLKISYNIIKGKKLNKVEEANGNNSIINKFYIDKKRECKVKALSSNIGNFIETYRNIEENLQDILLLVDVYGRINYASKRFYSLSGLEEDRVVGASFFTITHPEEILKARVLINLEKNNTIPIVHRIRKNNGNYILAESIADFIFEENNIMGKIIMSKDISNENL